MAKIANGNHTSLLPKESEGQRKCQAILSWTKICTVYVLAGKYTAKNRRVGKFLPRCGANAIGKSRPISKDWQHKGFDGLQVVGAGAGGRESRERIGSVVAWWVCVALESVEWLLGIR